MSCTGAYGYSMASNYNSLGKPAVVLVYEGNADLIIKRQTYEDLLSNHITPQRLKTKILLWHLWPDRRLLPSIFF